MSAVQKVIKVQRVILAALCLPALVFAKSNVVGFDENLNDSYIALGDVTHVSARVTQTFTVETWVKPASFQSWGGMIGAFQDNGSTEHGWVLGTSWSNRFSFGLATQGGDGLTYLRSDSATCASFDVDTWYHVAGVYDGAQMQLYVNGTLCNTSTAQSGAIDYPPSADFVLGMYKDDDEHNALDGQMAETRLWNVAKTAQQLKDAMNTRLTGDEAGLTGYWPLNEGTGTTTVDKTAQPLTGQLSQVTWGTSYLPVVDALPAIQTPVDINVLSLSTEYVHLGDVSAVKTLITKAFTVESWVKPNNFQYWGGILGAFQDNGSTEHGWVLGTSWSNQFSFAVASENGNGLTYLRTGGDNCGSFDVDTWHHVAGVYDGSQMQLYVDGILCNTSTAQSGDIDYPPTADFVLGAYKDNDEQNIFDGLISDTRMWDETRSKQQIRDSMGLRLTGTERGLVGYWPLDEDSGTVIVDKSSSQLNAQLGQITRTTAKLRLTDLVLTTNPAPATGWRTQGPLVLSPDGKPFTIKAINWFGFQTQRNIVHGLWELDYLSQLDNIKALGFNTIRLPYANTTLATNAKVTGYLASGNSDFIEDVTPALLAMDIFIDAAGSRGLYVILDRHSMQADITDPPLWYKDEVSESHWLRDWAFLADHYKDNPYVIGADLSNEPYGTATWGTGHPMTDWRLAAQKAGNAILANNPNWLIIVEGIDWSDHFFDHKDSLEGGVDSYPVVLNINDKVVYSPHEYGPDDSGYTHDWFTNTTTYAQAKARWLNSWGYIIEQGLAPVLIGEFGGRYVDQSSTTPLTNSSLTQGDAARWYEYMVNYIDEQQLSFAYWGWTPNSTNSGGILGDDYVVIQAKVDALAPLLGTAPSLSINNDWITTNEDTPTVMSVLDNDYDQNGGTVSVISATSGLHGQVNLLNGTLSYQPNSNYCGEDTFGYTAGTGGVIDSATVQLTVNCVNDAPVTVNDTAQVDEDGTVTIDVLTNDSDADGDTLSIESALANNGVVDINNASQLVYTPITDFNGTDTITYQLVDGNGGQTPGIVTVTVTSQSEGQLSPPQITPVSGTYPAPLTVTISHNDSAAIIEYSLDNISWQTYGQTLSLSENSSVYARAKRNDYGDSNAVTATYSLETEPPTDTESPTDVRVPDDLIAVQGSTSTIVNVSWSDTDLESVAYFDLQRYTSTDEFAVSVIAEQGWVTVSDSDSEKTAYSFVGVSGQTHYYRVRSCNTTRSACSEYSSIVRFYAGSDAQSPLAPSVKVTPSELASSTAVAAIAGQLSVNPGGSAVWSMPLALPIGIGGFKPAIGLSYSSLATNGAIGVGWQLSGLSQINRCNRYLEQDGYYQEVTLTDTDALCFNGQRLILVSGTAFEHGAIYRPQMDPTLVISYQVEQSNQYFKLRKPSGEISYFGETDDSVVSDNDSNINYQWLLNQRKDSYFNTIDFSYTGNNTTLRHIDTISYADNVIDFQYQTRPDGAKRYNKGTLIVDDQRMNAIVISNHGQMAINSYHFTHQLSRFSSRSLLTQIKRCNGTEDGTCQQPTTFTYEDNVPTGLAAPSEDIVVPIAAMFGFDAGDEIANGPSLKLIDSNGDGLSELAVLAGLDEQYTIKNLIVNGNNATTGTLELSGLSVAQSIQVDWCDSGALDFTSYRTYWEVTDLDGDGVDELTIDDPAGRPTIYVDLDGDGLQDDFAAAEGLMGDLYSEIDDDHCDTEITPQSVVDFNGDGLVDRTLAVSQSCTDPDGGTTSAAFSYQLKNTTVGNTFSEQYLDPDEGARSSRLNSLFYSKLRGDINGDGYADFNNMCGTGKGLGLTHCIDDNGIDEYPHQSPAALKKLGSYYDINRDGKQDLLYWESGTLYANISTTGPKQTIELGDFAAPNYLYTSSREACDAGQKTPTGQALWADLDGDGLPAFIYMDGATNTITIRPDANTANKPIDVLTAVDNGLALTQSVDYLPLTDNTVYQKYDDARTIDWGADTSAVFDAKNGPYVVSRLTSNQTSITYAYEGLRYQAGGVGSLGFAKVSDTNQNTGITKTQYYKQQRYFKGRLYKSEQVHSNGATLSSMEVTQWDHRSFLNGKLHQIEAKNTTTTLYTIDGNEGNEGVVGAVATPLSTTISSQTLTDDTTNYYAKRTSTVMVKTDEATGNELTVTKTFVYDSEDITNWHIQRPTNVTTVHNLMYADDTGTLTETAKTDTKQQQQTYAYNVKGRIGYQETGPSSSAPTYLKTAYIYGLHGNLTTTTQCSNHYADNCGTRDVPQDTDTDKYKVFSRSITTYDSDGRYADSISNGLFDVTKYQDHNTLGLPEKIVDANDVTQYLGYGAFGRVYFTGSDDGSYAQTTYALCDTECPASAVYKATNTTPNAPDSKVFYDRAGREVAVQTQLVNGNWSQIVKHYDANGALVSQSVPHQISLTEADAVEFDYDDLGRKYQETAPDGIVKQLSWSGYVETTKVTGSFSGQYNTTTAAINQTTKRTLNGFGQLRTSEDANQKFTSYQYGALGNLVLATNIDAKQTQIEYDHYGRKIFMDDPDKGEIYYINNAKGTVVQRITPSNTESYYFDAVGRQKRITTTSPAGDHTGEFYYSNALLARETGTEGVERQYYYDPLGRVRQVTHLMDGHEWQTSTTYGPYGRVFQQFDATGHNRGVQYTYKNGYSKTLIEASDTSKAYYDVTTMDVRGNVTGWTLGNTHTGTAAYDSQTGFLQSLFASNGSVAIQNHFYEYDGLGNLRARADLSGDLHQAQLVEAFDYDGLNRLKTVTFNAGPDLSLNYNDNGNIRSKSDVLGGETYIYGTNNAQCSTTPGPHALTRIGGEVDDDDTGYRYCYDNNANQTHSYKDGNKTREVTYTGYDKPSSIWSANAQTWFNYDAKHARFKRIDTDSDGTKTTYYVGGNEVVIHDSGLTEHKRYIGDVALDILRSNGSHETNYLYRDHIGSLVVIADDNGNLVQRLAYDAFGKRREGLSWNPVQILYANPSIKSALDITQKGFTDHEHVDHADIIHMGGRIYDPTLGRFIQADPIVQAPENGQSLNRYSYVFNNPLSYTDPTGYCAMSMFAIDCLDEQTTQGRDTYTRGGNQSTAQFDSATNSAKTNDKDTAVASIDEEKSGGNRMQSDDGVFGNSSGDGKMKTNTQVRDGFKASAKKYGIVEGNFQVTDDLTLNYQTSGSKGFDKTILKHLNKLKGNKHGLNMLTGLAKGIGALNIYENIGQSATTSRSLFDVFGYDTTIAFDTQAVGSPVAFENRRGNPIGHSFNPRYVLAHELFHAWQNVSYFSDAPIIGRPVAGENGWEVAAVRFTNQIRRADHRSFTRTQYSIGGPRIDSYQSVRERTR